MEESPASVSLPTSSVAEIQNQTARIHDFVHALKAPMHSLDTDVQPNPQALNALKRVSHRLTGKDMLLQVSGRGSSKEPKEKQRRSSSRRNVSVAEQVDTLINQALSVDNLCQLFEGMLAWF